MNGYNKYLNNSSDHKQALIKALVMNTPLPHNSYAPPVILETEDPLLKALAARDYDVDTFMRLQYEKFGSIDTELFWSCLKYVADHAVLPSSPLKELLVQGAADTSFVPNNSLFQQWRHLHYQHFSQFITAFSLLIPLETREYTPDELRTFFTEALHETRLHAMGWRVELNDGTNMVGVARSSKKILIGTSSMRLGRERLIGLLLHELYIHAMWAEKNHEKQHDAGNEEGIGTLMEQLMYHSFQPLRMYRFLAICLAAGVDGTMRDMRGTFALLSAIRQALKPKEDEMTARRFVAKEVTRVFRGLPPDIPGLVYIRDKYYLEHNKALWGKLAIGVPTRKRYIALVAPWEEKV